MTDYDPNLPQEFAHMPKKHGPGAIMLIIAIIAVFILGALFASLRHRGAGGEGAAATPPATQVETNVNTPAPPANAPSVDKPPTSAE